MTYSDWFNLYLVACGTAVNSAIAYIAYRWMICRMDDEWCAMMWPRDEHDDVGNARG